MCFFFFLHNFKAFCKWKYVLLSGIFVPACFQFIVPLSRSSCAVTPVWWLTPGNGSSGSAKLRLSSRLPLEVLMRTWALGPWDPALWSWTDSSSPPSLTWGVVGRSSPLSQGCCRICTTLSILWAPGKCSVVSTACTPAVLVSHAYLNTCWA